MNTLKPTLYIFSGLPGVGKTTLSRLLAKKLGIMHIRIDTIEQGIRDLCKFKVEGEGYRLAYRIVSDNLQLGQCVVADSCNPWDLTRDEWEQVAKSAMANFVNFEIICSDQDIHKKRIESRHSDIERLNLPTWQDVLDRDYHPWKKNRIVIDTAKKEIKTSFAELLEKMPK